MATRTEQPEGEKKPRKKQVLTMGRQKWTKAEEAHILKHRNVTGPDFQEWKQIADRLGRLETGCRTKMNRLLKKMNEETRRQYKSPSGTPQLRTLAPMPAVPAPPPTMVGAGMNDARASPSHDLAEMQPLDAPIVSMGFPLMQDTVGAARSVAMGQTQMFVGMKGGPYLQRFSPMQDAAGANVAPMGMNPIFRGGNEGQHIVQTSAVQEHDPFAEVLGYMNETQAHGPNLGEVAAPAMGYLDFGEAQGLGEQLLWKMNDGHTIDQFSAMQDTVFNDFANTPQLW